MVYLNSQNSAQSVHSLCENELENAVKLLHAKGSCWTQFQKPRNGKLSLFHCKPSILALSYGTRVVGPDGSKMWTWRTPALGDLGAATGSLGSFYPLVISRSY